MTTSAETNGFSPTVKGSDGPFKWDSTSEPWKKTCASLPCFEALSWPDYDTKCWYEYELFGKPVVIQLWKGHCQQLLGRTDFPGGVGGEVGIYYRDPTKTNLPSLNFLPESMKATYLIASRLAPNKLWWPVPDELQPKIQWSFINPKTGSPIFVDPQHPKTYWLTKWMEFDSFGAYEKANDTPTWATDFHMTATISDDTQDIIIDW